ncbi:MULTISPECIES: recombinase family protein [unclassified Crossiella]|uniref:recombinase family protein n=1 Tax=unclassified Crossiella TaxID=2620835 RepID=UPI001FFED9F4|nr:MULTISPECIES: recombinase family protein [unclassified Crossiella]MCK2239409.1 recombinase family protein [Crossiella sp. S99.2]MCK2252104.1 recombinase family protein [Crossiella sp. S99.1]
MSAPTPRRRRRFKKQVSERLPAIPFTPEDDASVCYSRQSHFSDESTSSESQNRDTHRWSNAYDVPIAATVEDLSVSGDLEPHKRNGLKVWLCDAPPKPWKTLVVSKLDRLVRNVMDALTLLEWLRSRGKRLISIAEGIDSSNSMSEFLITLIAAFARMERERMRERFRSSKATLKAAGRWSGGGHIYGTMPVELPGGGWFLGIDQYAVRILHKLSKMARTGVNLTDMCAWLNENKVLSPTDRQIQLYAERQRKDPETTEFKGYKWQRTVVRRLLEHPDLVELGIFEPAEQAEISARLEEKSRRKNRGSNQPRAFSGVLVCPDCLEPLWHRGHHDERIRADGTVAVYDYRYWRCGTPEHGFAMRADEIEPLAEQAFYKIFSMVPVRERIVMPPTDHANEIAKLEREYTKEMSKVARAGKPEDRSKAMANGAMILADIDTLRALPVDPGGVQWVPTDRTWKEELEGLQSQDRRLRWLELGFQFAAKKRPDGSWSARWRLPDGWQEAMPELAAWNERVADNGATIEIADLLSPTPTGRTETQPGDS